MQRASAGKRIVSNKFRKSPPITRPWSFLKRNAPKATAAQKKNLSLRKRRKELVSFKELPSHCLKGLSNLRELRAFGKRVQTSRQAVSLLNAAPGFPHRTPGALRLRTLSRNCRRVCSLESCICTRQQRHKLSTDKCLLEPSTQSTTHAHGAEQHGIPRGATGPLRH